MSASTSLKNISATSGRGFVLPTNLFSAEKPASLHLTSSYGQDQGWTGHHRHRSNF